MECQNVNLKEAFFIESELKNISFDKTIFHKTEFLHTNLAGIDFSTSDITGVMMDSFSMKGIKVNSFQCRDLIGILKEEVVD